MKITWDSACLQSWDTEEYRSNGQTGVTLPVLGDLKILGRTHTTNRSVQN